MTSRIWDNTAKRWKITKVQRWAAVRSAWEEGRGTEQPGMQTESIFSPYIGAGTIWQRSVTSMPTDPLSAQYAGWMWAHSPTEYKTVTGTPSGAFGAKTALNTSAANTHPIACVVVDSTDPRCRYQYMDTVVGPKMTTAEVDAYIKGAIPWPTGFTPALNGDRGMAIYDRGTGICREYFNVNAVANKPGHWTASVGAYSVAKPHFQDWPQTNYAMQYQNGSNNVVQMHNALGFIGIDEVRRGRIDHAIAYTTANFDGTGFPNAAASWPAMGSDGKYPPSTWSGWQENGGAAGPWPGPTPMHGQWCRLPLSVNPELNPRTNMPYNPLTKLIIKAAQTYGMVSTDTNAWAHAFNTESGNHEKAITGIDPWTPTTGEMAKLLSDYSNATVTPTLALDVSDFPWDLTIWAPRDWGRPSPDFKLRQGEVSYYAPYVTF